MGTFKKQTGVKPTTKKAAPKKSSKKSSPLPDIMGKNPASGLPRDASTQHDHYHYGAPKRQKKQR